MIIKESQQKNYLNTTEVIKKELYISIFSDYYMNLSEIDFTLGTTMFPVNQALKRAIEEVLHYYAYHLFPVGLDKTA